MVCFFFFNDTAPTEIYTLSLHDALPILAARLHLVPHDAWAFCWMTDPPLFEWSEEEGRWVSMHHPFTSPAADDLAPETDRKSTRLNSSHANISYAVFCLKKNKQIRVVNL